MRALSIRQPYAELILRGLKTIEYRSKPTKIIGERFWIYATKTRAATRRSDDATRGIWSKDLSGAQPPPWIVELATAMELFEEKLPTGVIVGSAVIERVSPHAPRVNHQPFYQWHLSQVERVTRLRKPTRQPQPVWFHPFD